MNDWVTPILVLLLILGVTPLPLAVAHLRKHRDRRAITKTNLVAMLLPVGACGCAMATSNPHSHDCGFGIALSVLMGLLAGFPLWVVAMIWSALPTVPPPRQ